MGEWLFTSSLWVSDGFLCFQGKEVATDVRLLPQGTVIFEDISIEHFEGTVTKVIPKVPSKNQVNFSIY